MSSTEKLPAPRIPLQFDVEYRRSYARNPGQGKLKNISLTGAFLESTEEDLRSNDKVCLILKVGGRIRKINASIIWTNDNGAGLKFMPENNRDVQIVDDLIYFVETKRENRRDVLNNIFKQVA